MNVKFLLNQSAKWRVLYLAAFITCLSILGVSAYENYSPTVSSDKDDYAPGEVAIITGYGWTQDQFVDVHFKETPAYHEEHQHDYHDIAVDADGKWTIEYQIEDRHLGVAFDVHVVGKQSGAEAYTHFTDANVTFAASGLPSNTSLKVSYRINNTNKTPESTEEFTPPGTPKAVAVPKDDYIQYTFPDVKVGEVVYSSTSINASGTNQTGPTNTFKLPNNGGHTITGVYVPNCTTPATPAVTVDNCNGTSTLSTTATGTLAWSTGANTSSITVSTAGTYTVTTTVNGCTSAAGSGTAAPKTTPTTPTITAASSTTVCPGSSVVLSSSSANGNQWCKGGVAIADATSQSYTANENGDYTVIVTSNGCSSAVSNTINVTVGDVTAPVVPTLADVTGECSATATAPTTTDNCAGTITGTTTDALTYSTQGTHEITWSFNDGNGNVSTAKQKVIVRDVTAPTISAPATVTVAANASCTATGVVLGNATTADNCSVASVTNNAPASFPLGNTTVTWTVTDGVGLTATATQTVTVTNTAPSDIVFTGPADPIQLNSSVTLNADFSDNNIKSATWNWRGTGTEGGKTLTASSASATYTYSQPGVYTVTLTLEDHCGATSTKDFEYVVIFDPSGGFVTGGGWIDSPPGAHVVNLNDNGGRANFGFVAKYKKGSNEVDGNTVFQYQTGSLNFKSTSHTAGTLVISGGFKATFKGEGFIGNDLTVYQFMVVSTDGQATGGDGKDRFRMKIWNKSTKELVYDNQFNNADNAELDDRTVLAGGSIVIHESKTVSGGTTAKKLVADVTALPETATRFQNYPNPYNDRTTITFSSVKAESFALEVYDVKGALVKKVDMGVTEAGRTYEYEFESRNMPEGMYFARLITNSGVQTIKMVLKK